MSDLVFHAQAYRITWGKISNIDCRNKILRIGKAKGNSRALLDIEFSYNTQFKVKSVTLVASISDYPKNFWITAGGQILESG